MYVILGQDEPVNNGRLKTVQSESTVKLSNFCAPAAYSIHVEGLLDESWSDRFAGMKIKTNERKNLPPVTTLNGQLTDQAELLGVLNSLYNLRITLMAVERLDEPSTRK
jgi:hypothetical protein